MRNSYPNIPGAPTLVDLVAWVRKVIQYRQLEDLPDYINQKNIYVSGRSTTRIPSSATNVVDGDREGDTVAAVDGSYQYTLIDQSGTLVWARVALDTAW